MTRFQSASTLASCFVLFVGTSVHAWLNDFDQPVNFTCPTGQFISSVSSAHDNHHEDRVWDFGCRKIPGEVVVGGCNWTHYVNDWDQPLTYQCPDEGFIAGTASTHDNKHEDRRFSFKCCAVTGAVAHGCSFTGYMNDWDGVLDYVVPDDKVMTGMDSYHSNDHEDRRFKFEICDLNTQ